LKQQQFEDAHEAFWTAFAGRLKNFTRSRKQAAREDAAGFLSDYRLLCHHLSLARSRGYTSGLVQRLNSLMLEGHWLLYRNRRMRFVDLARFIRQDFPRAVRAQWRLLVTASLLFYGAALLVAALVVWFPDTLYHLLDAQQINSLEAMYNPGGEHLGRVRDDAIDVQMFGFYIRNNISIGLQTIASGLLVGLGTAFFLVFNGVFMGAAAGHLHNVGYSEPFWTFVLAHGAFELTAITLAGMAGLHLGNALLAPGLQTRLTALRQHAADTVPILYGVVIMLVVAAVIEAFWSSKPLPAEVKYAAGMVCWAVVSWYFLRCGRVRYTISIEIAGDGSAPAVDNPKAGSRAT
jgi:uncharacterized membrane protein SpoIIM required for sporulation